MRELELESGEVIEDVTRITEPDVNGLVNVHSPGSGYRVVDPDRIVSEREVPSDA